MDKSVNARLRAWYKALKSVGIVSKQDDIRIHLTNRDGNPVTQGFVAAMMTGNSPVPPHMLTQLHEAFPFTSEEFYSTGQDSMIDPASLVRYIIDKESIEVDKLLKESGVSNSFISQMTFESSDKDMMQSVFDCLNEHGYNLQVEDLIARSEKTGGFKRDFKGADEYTVRFLSVIEFLIKSGRVASRTDLCERINITSSHLSNMTHPGMKAKVSVKMLKSLVTAFPDINLDYIVSGTGNKLKDSSDLIVDILDLKKGQIQIRKILEKLSQSSFAVL